MATDCKAVTHRGIKGEIFFGEMEDNALNGSKRISRYGDNSASTVDFKIRDGVG